MWKTGVLNWGAGEPAKVHQQGPGFGKPKQRQGTPPTRPVPQHIQLQLCSTLLGTVFAATYACLQPSKYMYMLAAITPTVLPMAISRLELDLLSMGEKYENTENKPNAMEQNTRRGNKHEPGPASLLARTAAAATTVLPYHGTAKYQLLLVLHGPRPWQLHGTAKGQLLLLVTTATTCAHDDATVSQENNCYYYCHSPHH